jgi:hypothetical protein
MKRRHLLSLSLLHAAGIAAAGCGTILHPERRGQPTGRLDWGVVLLDGLGLLLFFVPGVIAFAVDFATGAIYLPPEEYGQLPNSGEQRLVKLSASPQPTNEQIEEIVSRHVGRPVRLSPGEYVTRKLDDISDFWSVRAKLLKGKRSSS